MANEITGRDTDDDQTDDVTLTWDKVGNLRSKDDGTTTATYTHDGWNRLVTMERDSGGGGNTFAEYSYNGLNWRVSKRADNPGGDDLDEH